MIECLVYKGPISFKLIKNPIHTRNRKTDPHKESKPDPRKESKHLITRDVKVVPNRTRKRFVSCLKPETHAFEKRIVKLTLVCKQKKSKLQVGCTTESPSI